MKMKRIFQSFVGGNIIVLVLFLLISALDELIIQFDSSRSPVERNPVYWLLEWPVPVLKDIFPPESGAMVTLSPIGLVIAILLNVVGYSVLVYIILRWRAGRTRLP
jgi:hypothetical protein